MSKKTLFALLPCLIWLLYLFGILDLVDIRYDESKGYMVTDANIVYIEHSGGRSHYKLGYTYIVDGVKYAQFDDERSFSGGYVKGDSIVIRYSADEPKYSYIARIKAGTWIKDKFFYALLLCFMGTIAMMMGESKDKIIKDVRR